MEHTNIDFLFIWLIWIRPAMPCDMYITGWSTALHHPVSCIILRSLLSSFREFYVGKSIYHKLSPLVLHVRGHNLNNWEKIPVFTLWRTFKKKCPLFNKMWREVFLITKLGQPCNDISKTCLHPCCLNLLTRVINCLTQRLVINLLKRKRRLLYLKTQFVPHSKHFSFRL